LINDKCTCGRSADLCPPPAAMRAKAVPSPLEQSSSSGSLVRGVNDIS
jgi:hypothetical protein